MDNAAKQPKTSQYKVMMSHFVQYMPLIRELVGRDLKVKYRRSFLGYVWSILNPLLTLMSFIMGLIGGYFIISLTGMIKVADYIEGLRFAFNGYYITYSIVKTAVFSFIISSISSYYGYYAVGGSLGVGRSATKAIVAASAAILIFNLILTRIML